MILSVTFLKQFDDKFRRRLLISCQMFCQEMSTFGGWLSRPAVAGKKHDSALLLNLFARFPCFTTVPDYFKSSGGRQENSPGN
jgi:hypothetical protein